MLKEITADGKTGLDWTFKARPDETYTVAWEGCKNPFCMCPELEVNFYRDPELKIPAGQLFVDVDHERLIRKKTPEAHRRFAKRFMKETTAETWEFLGNAFVDAKLQATEDYDGSTGEPPDFEIEDEGLTIRYREIFPWTREIGLLHEGNEYRTDEAYCVSKDCPCTVVAVTFLPLKDLSGLEEAHAPLVYFDYNARRIIGVIPGNAVPHAPRELHAALLLQNPQAIQTFRRRHAQMRTAYKKHVKSLQTATAAPAAGRNDPCPCGSGKKYKKCCGKAGA